MFYLFLADGFEETEALAPLDMMRRAKIEVKTVGVTGEFVTGSHGVTVKADLKPEEISFNNIDGVVLPGGMPGTVNLGKSETVTKAAKLPLPSAPLRLFWVTSEYLKVKKQPVSQDLKKNLREQHTPLLLLKLTAM